jgi:hypothetical protein
MGLGRLAPSRQAAHSKDETGLRTEIIGIVKAYADNAPRSQQKRVGPSEVGTPCDRQLAYKMAGMPESRKFHDIWPSFVGTAVHGELASALEWDNQRLISEGKPARWLIEHRVSVGFGLEGSSDFFDTWTGTVGDHKILGQTSYQKFVREGPSQTYETQAHCYGLGFARQGYEVKRVAIFAYGRAKSLTDLHVWSAPWDIDVALRALQRMRRIQSLLDSGVHPKVARPTPGGACIFCPFKSITGKDEPCNEYCTDGD